MKFSRNPTSTPPNGPGPPDAPAPPGRRHRLRLTIAISVAAATVITLSAVFAGIASASTYRSGLPWASGVYQPNSTPASLATFGTWRGHPMDVATVWGNRATWNEVINPAFLFKRWQHAPEILALGMPMLPEKVPGVSIQACATGAYNSYWRQFGTNISAYGLGSSIIRLGWEFNGNWYIWQASNPATWVKCWQQIVTSARSTAPNLQWDWNVNRGVSAGLADPTQAYPGDAYVTTIGVDNYDQWPPANAAGGWNTQLNGPQGLMYWLNFAQAHGKKFAIPEWGNMTTGTDPGRDDPAFVNDMLGFFKAHAGSLAWEANFQGPNINNFTWLCVQNSHCKFLLSRGDDGSPY